MNRRRVAALAVLVAASSTGLAGAAEPPGCALRGPAPDVRVVAFDLARPMELALRLSGTQPAFASGSGWHVTAGIAIFRRDRLDRALATRLLHIGASPPTVGAQARGTAVQQDAVGPMLPFRQDQGTSIPVLPRGRYVAVGFAADGGADAPYGIWEAELKGSRALFCTPTGQGTLVERDVRDLRGDMAYTPAGGAGSGATDVDVPGRHAFGALSATAHAGPAEAVVQRGRQVLARATQQLSPVVGRGGRLRLTADWAGAAAAISWSMVGFRVEDERPRWS